MSARNGYHDEEVLVRSYDRHLLRRLLRYLKPYRLVVAAGLVLLLVIAALEISTTFLIQIGIDDYIAAQNTGGLQMIAMAYFAVILLVLIGSGAQLYLTMWLGQKVQHDIRTEVFAHLQKLPTAFFDRNPVGRLITRVTSDVGTLNELFSSGVVTMIGDVLSLVFIVSALLYYNWRLALLTFLVLPLLGSATFWFRSKIRVQYREIRTRLARLNAFVQENLTGIDQVQLFGREESTIHQFAGINRSVRSANLKSVYYSALFLPTVEAIGALSIAILLHAGGIRVLDEALTFGELVAFIYLVERFYQPIQSLSEEFGTLQASMASSERIFQLLDTQPSSTSPNSMPLVGLGKTGISFDQVWFAYEGEDWVLKDISFCVEPGERVAIVGATGAGKTSLASLLFRFYDCQRGTISIGGTPTSDLPISQLRSHMGLVPQDGFLFSGTVADNIRLGDASISDELVSTALKQVGFNDNGHLLPDGLNTLLLEGGSALSAGQKQLLSMARVLAHDPAILILDEATSSVDTETERRIERALDFAMRDRTSIVIAHRLSTIRKADKIIVLHHGELREAGTHEELLAKGGIYDRLYRMQFENSEFAPNGPEKLS